MRSREKPVEEMEQETDRRDAFWQQKGATDYALWVDGEKQAAVDLAKNSGEIFRDDALYGDEFAVPDYVSVFDEAERQLGLPRVDDIRDADGKPDPEVRLSVEQTAGLDREARTPVQWVRAYALRAFDILNRRLAFSAVTRRAEQRARKRAGAGRERFRAGALGGTPTRV